MKRHSQVMFVNNKTSLVSAHYYVMKNNEKHVNKITTIYFRCI